MYNGGYTEVSMDGFVWELGDTARGVAVENFYNRCLNAIKNGKAIYLSNGRDNESGFFTCRTLGIETYLHNGFYKYTIKDEREVGGNVFIAAVKV